MLKINKNDLPLFGSFIDELAHKAIVYLQNELDDMTCMKYLNLLKKMNGPADSSINDRIYGISKILGLYKE